MDLYSSGIDFLAKGNIVAHVKSMVGKDFKSISKIIILCLEYIEVDQRILNAWNYICMITKFVNLPKHSNADLDEFSEKITKAVTDIGNAFPTLKKSVKLHLCLHLESNIKRHGAPLGYSTEVFESFNHHLRGLIDSTNQIDYTNDAIKYYYQSIRAKLFFDAKVNSKNIVCENVLDTPPAYEKQKLAFTSLEFSGSYESFTLISTLKYNSILKNFLSLCNGEIKIFKKIANENSKKVFIFNSGKYYILKEELNKNILVEEVKYFSWGKN